MKYLILIIIIILIFIGIAIYNIYQAKQGKTKLQEERINESIKTIELLLDKKEKVLEDTISVIKNSNKKKYTKKEILENLIKNKSKKLTLIQKHDELRKLMKEFNTIIEDDKKLEENKKLTELRYELSIIETDLISTCKFYNKYINKKETKFNIEKEEELEILKENSKKEKAD